MADEHETPELGDGNEAEAFLKKIIIKAVVVTALLVIGVAIAVVQMGG